MVKLWRQDARVERYTTAGFSDESMEALDASGENYGGAAPLSDQFPKLTIRIRTRHAPDDYFTVGILFVASEGIKRILEEFNVKAQYFQLDVIYRRKPYLKRRFFFVHLLDYVDCFDFDRSQYAMETKKGWPDRVKTIEMLAIDESKAAGYDLFILDKVRDLVRCASDELAARVENSGMTGVEFVPPSMWGRY